MAMQKKIASATASVGSYLQVGGAAAASFIQRKAAERWARRTTRPPTPRSRSALSAALAILKMAATA